MRFLHVRVFGWMCERSHLFQLTVDVLHYQINGHHVPATWWNDNRKVRCSMQYENNLEATSWRLSLEHHSLRCCSHQVMQLRVRGWRTYREAPQYQPGAWLVRCTAQRMAWQTYCTVWWRPRCPGLARLCPSSAAAQDGCLSRCRQKSSCPVTSKANENCLELSFG